MIMRSRNTSEKMMFSAVTTLSLCTLVLGACMTSVGGTTAIQPGYGLRHPHLSPLNETANAPSHDEDASGNLWEMKPSSSPLPDARSGSGGAMIPCEGFMVFGGCSSSCCYSPLSDTWKWVNGVWSKVQGTSEPTGRVFHTVVNHGNKALLFAGSSVSNGFLNDLWQLDLGQLCRSSPNWNEPSVKGKRPPVRGSHSAEVNEKGEMYVYGGRNRITVLKDFWVLDVESLTWSKLNDTNGPGRLASHASVWLNGLLYIFGGSNALGEDNNRLWTFDPFSQRWSEIEPTSQAVPAARHGHVIWATQSGDIMLFGGKNGTAEHDAFLGDTWLFNVQTKAWKKLQEGVSKPSKEQPNERVYPAFASANGTQLLFGGFSGYTGGLNDKLHNDLWEAP